MLPDWHFSFVRIILTLFALFAGSAYGTEESTQQVSFFEIPQALKKLKHAENQFRAELKELPVLSETLQIEAYGFHGGYVPALKTFPDQPRWTLDFTFEHDVALSKVILVPAVDHQFGHLGSQGFPRRFRVSSISADGQLHVVKEWMDTDCPDPGRFPLIIDLPSPRSEKLRLEVFRGALAGDREFFALDELFGVMGAVYQQCIEVTASSEFQSPPYWSKKFLIDQKTSLGLPLDIRQGTRPKADDPDFAISFKTPPPQGCVVELDLGQNQSPGWITLFPAQPPEGIMHPGYGFPKEINLEIVKETDSGERGEVQSVAGAWHSMRPGNNVVRLSCAGMTGRWIRIHADNLPRHNGRRTFALGEIQVYQGNKPSAIKSIHLEGFPRKSAASANRMIDGTSGGFTTLPLLDWLHLIERRKEVSGSLTELRSQQNSLNLRWKRVWKISGFGSAALLTFLAILVATVTMVHRKTALNKLKWRIARDLHDEVGSSLGSISLTAERLEADVKDADTKEDLCDLSLLAREATASLRDVVWMVDQTHIRFPALLQKLVHRAERVLGGVSLDVEISSACPDQVVPLSFKRHLVMFFKEVIHNCARHSGARHVSISLTTDAGDFLLQVKDDGCGFDPENTGDGWGLDSLNKRAGEMGGRMALQSAPGRGTRVDLMIPLKAIFRTRDHRYKTSN